MELSKSGRNYADKVGFINDEIYVVLMPDTFSIKDKLKSEGAKFNRDLGNVWYFSDNNHDYPLLRLSIDDCLEDSNRYVRWKPSAADIVKQNMPDPEIKGDYVGNVGDTVTVNGKIVSQRYFDGRFGAGYSYTIEGDDGNYYLWYTSKWLENIVPNFNELYRNDMSLEEEPIPVIVVGKIKAYKEFHNTKFTVLTRCKIY